MKRPFKELPFHGTSIEKQYIDRLNNVAMLREFSFYGGLNMAIFKKVNGERETGNEQRGTGSGE